MGGKYNQLYPGIHCILKITYQSGMERWKMKRKWMGASLALASIGLLAGPLQGAEAATPKIKVHYIDVGQGDAIYIKMPSGEDIVIDGGNKGKGEAHDSSLQGLLVGGQTREADDQDGKGWRLASCQRRRQGAIRRTGQRICEE